MRSAESTTLRPLVLMLLILFVSGSEASAQQATVRRTAAAVERAAEARAARKATNQYDDTFKKYSKRYFGAAFDWTHFKAQAMAESGLNPDATS